MSCMPSLIRIEIGRLADAEEGMWNHENIAGGLYGVSVALFTRALGWTKEELEVFLVDVRKELKDMKIHSYFPL